jgi:hypothetical protein
MKIAFDVNGTLLGEKGELIMELLKTLLHQGHECIVWSNDFYTASNFVKENNLNVNFMQKISKKDCIKNNNDFFDIAIEDDVDSTCYLAANKFVLVQSLPHSIDEIIYLFFNN